MPPSNHTPVLPLLFDDCVRSNLLRLIIFVKIGYICVDIEKRIIHTAAAGEHTHI